MSGEWAAAIYYDGIATDPNAMWLTDEFIYPNWPTESNFVMDTWFSRWNDPYNPVNNYDTGQSIIKNNEVEVTIDYEVVDINEVGWWSPLVYGTPNEPNQVAKSERYLFLQTYTIKNIKASGNITGLEFYQMLHSHGDDDYGAVVHSTYETLDINDPLENYTPYNPVHTIGNFRYDITQWNNIDDPSASANHTDWVGFSCAVEPNMYECGYFPGHSSKPQSGTHISIEERNLDSNDYSYGETAGAMGWYLPDIGPDETTSITVAFMFGTTEWPFPTILTKANADPNNDCVYPWNMIDENYLTFEVCYDANGYALDDVNIIDYLPIEVDYYSSNPNGTYDPNAGTAGTVTWAIGDLSESDSNCIELVTKVNYYAKPGGIFTNEVRMESSEGICAEAATDVNVCYDGYGMSIIYVDKDANDPNSFNNGRSWDNAYTDLRDAFTGAESGGASVTAIWVAEGRYKPVWDMGDDQSYKNETFALLENVGLLGHFAGNEDNPSDRNFSDPNNETILEGQIGESVSYAVYDVLKADNIENAILDGFTVRGAYSGSGIYLNASKVSIVNCKFKSNRNYGVEAYYFSEPDIHNCLFMDNSSQGIRVTSSCEPIVSYCTFDGNDTTTQGIYMGGITKLDVEDSVFKDHTGDGIDGDNGQLTLTNCTFEGNNDNGLELGDVTTTVTNCSIKNSNDNGIQASDSDLIIDHSVIEHSTDNALYMSNGSILTLKNSVLRYSGEDGIELNDNLGTTITNNWIHNNGTDQYGSGGAGISFKNQSSKPLVRNNTIYGNRTYGIEYTEQGLEPNIINCIIYGNDSNDLYRENDTFDTVNYCLLQVPRPNNITGDPCFVDPNSNDLHIREYSVCKDAGDPNGSYGDETDIDGEARIIYGRVDIGADEYYWSPADFYEDGFVNFIDYATFASAWQSESGDGNYDEDCDLEDNNAIDYDDLALFCKDWLWEVAWGDTQWMMSMGVGGMGFGLESMSLMESSLSLDSYETTSTAKRGDALMLSAAESLRTRPERLIAKSQKFYDITPQAIAESKTVRPKPPTMRELYERQTRLLKWLDEIWINGDIDWTEERFLEFRKSIEESGF